LKVPFAICLKILPVLTCCRIPGISPVYSFAVLFSKTEKSTVPFCFPGKGAAHEAESYPINQKPKTKNQKPKTKNQKPKTKN